MRSSVHVKISNSYFGYLISHKLCFLGTALRNLLCVLLWVSMCVPLNSCRMEDPTLSQGLIIDSSYLSKPFRSGPGTVHVFITNMGHRTVRLEEGFINDRPLSDQGAFLWHRISPNPIQPLETSELIVRLRKSPVNPPSPASANVRLITAEGKELTTSIPLINHQLQFTFIGFSDSLGLVFLYIKNYGQKNLLLDKVFLSSKNVTRNCRIPEPGIGQNKKVLAVIELDEPLIKGQYIVVAVTTKEGVTAKARARAFSNFPLACDPDGSDVELFMNEAEFKWKNENENAEYVAYHILDCPMHLGEDTSIDAVISNAKTILAKMEEKIESTCFLPRFIHVCRTNIYNGCAYFGQIADFMRINPTVVLLQDANRKTPYNIEPVQHLTAFAKKACEPKPIHTSIAATSPNAENLNPTPELERLLVYAAVSRGSKGIFYRIWNDSLKEKPKLRQEIKKINGELQVLKRFLKIGEPMPLAACTHPDVGPTTILAGDKAIVLILINRKPIESENTEDGIRASFSPKLKFEVVVHIPRWMQIKDVYEVGEDFGRPEYSKRGNRIIIKVDRLDFTRQIVLTTRADDYDHDQDQDGISDINEILVHNTHPAIPNLHPTSQVATD